jgi:hypothetical protein
MTLSGKEAARGSWGRHSALTELRAAAAEVVRLEDEIRSPELRVREGTPPDELCGIPRPAPLADREALTLTVDFPVEVQPRCPARVSLYRSDGDIEAVVAWSRRPLLGRPSPSPVPDVVGMTRAEARDAVTAAGFTARVEKLEACEPRRTVADQAPTQQALDEDFADDPEWSGVVTIVVEVPHRTRDCAALEAAAAAFEGFARGGAPPAWAPQVQQLVGYAVRDRIAAGRADDPAAWLFCAGDSTSGCALSPLAVLRAGQVATGESRENYECELADLGGLPSGLNPEDRIVLFPAHPSACATDWSVELWTDDLGRISAVNLLASEAAVEASE